LFNIFYDLDEAEASYREVYGVELLEELDYHTLDHVMNNLMKASRGALSDLMSFRSKGRKEISKPESKRSFDKQTINNYLDCELPDTLELQSMIYKQFLKKV
jgi:translation initiation factor 2 beta subunit (eIF-2beta)/eIF-5